MNFATVRQYKGQKEPGTDYAQKIDMDGTVVQIGQPGQSRQHKPNLTVMIKDSAGEMQNVVLMGTLPSNDILNQLAPFAVSITGQAGQEVYRGFWQNKKNIGAVVTAALNPPAQTQPAGQQPTYHPVEATPPELPSLEKSYDDRESDRNASICRQCAGKAAAEIVASQIHGQSDIATSKIITTLAAITGPLSHWFINGKWPDVPMDEYEAGQQPAEQTATDEQGNPLPF